MRTNVSPKTLGKSPTQPAAPCWHGSTHFVAVADWAAQLASPPGFTQLPKTKCEAYFVNGGENSGGVRIRLCEMILMKIRCSNRSPSVRSRRQLNKWWK